jgi:SAM-dependent methyltransferase
MTSPDYSADFYRHHARQYAQVAQEWRQSVYIKSSHPALQNDWDAWERLRQLTPGNRGLDAGCGAGARDVFHLWSQGYDVVGFDSVDENIQVALQLHPEIADRVFVASLGEALNFEDNSFDFVMCNAVIQHIEPEVVRSVVLPELARVLRPEGVLQLMFKNGEGVLTMFDQDYGVQRNFQLFDGAELLEVLEGQDMTLIDADTPDQLGGFLYFTDGKGVDHGLFFSRKQPANP